jgi:hypothetical protein
VTIFFDRLCSRLRNPINISIRLGSWLLCVLVLACGRQQLDDPSGAGSAGSTGTGGSVGIAGAAGAGSGGITGAAGTAGASGSGGTTTASGAGKFFDVCLVQADCYTGLSCICGICSTPCDPGTCTRLPVGATCPTYLPSTSACLVPTTAICVIECSTDGDCRSLGPTAVCTAGWCRRPLLVTVVDGGVLTCADRAANMEALLDPAIASADRSCMTDADCVLAPTGNECFGGGCGGVPVSMAGAAKIKAELGTLQNQDCDAVLRAGCVGPGLIRCPDGGYATCVAGQCQNNGPVRGP